MWNFRRCVLLACVIVAACIDTTAQNSPQSKELLVGVILDSNYARITDFLPRLRDSVVKTLTQRKKQIRAVALDSLAEDPEEAARSKSCKYLLQMNVSESTGGRVGTSTGISSPTFPSRSLSPEEERERRELAFVRIDYRLKSLKDGHFNVTDTDFVRSLDIPSTLDAMAFETTVFRTVTRVAVAAMGKLPER